MLEPAAIQAGACSNAHAQGSPLHSQTHTAGGLCTHITMHTEPCAHVWTQMNVAPIRPHLTQEHKKVCGQGGKVQI